MIFMDSYKVIIFDLDGTLFYKDQMISDNAAKKNHRTRRKRNCHWTWQRDDF